MAKLFHCIVFIGTRSEVFPNLIASRVITLLIRVYDLTLRRSTNQDCNIQECLYI